MPTASKPTRSQGRRPLIGESPEASSAESELPALQRILASNPGWLDEAIDTLETSRITSRPVTTLETLRVRGGGPPFLQQDGGRAVRYRRRDVFDWMARAVRTSTAGRVASLKEMVPKKPKARR
jgi:hypothetical protein